MEKTKNMQDLIDEYMSMADYFESEKIRVQNEIQTLTTKSAENSKKIAELEAEAIKKGLLKSSAPEEQKKPKDALQLITRLDMSSTGMTTFSYIADEKNPPIGKNDRVFIVGELTKGKFVEMKPIKKGNIIEYQANIVAEPGYKYTFCFKVGDAMTIDSHYPIYLTKVGRSVNYVNVVDPRKAPPTKSSTFVDKTMHHIERKRLEELYNKVISAGELPMLKELSKHIGQLYYSVDTPNGIFRLTSVNIDRNFEEI